MRYPDFIKKNATIGIVAPSAGIKDWPYSVRLDSAIKNLEKLGFKIVLSPSVRQNEKFVSASGEVRAKEFMDMWLDDSIDAIISAAGGEFMQEILPYIDFNKIKKAKPKYFQGMSDNTNLVLTLTTLCDVASVYGDNIGHFGKTKWHRVLNNQINFLLGINKPVESEKKYEVERKDKEIGHENAPYNCTQKSKWKILSGEKSVEFSGRLIGGCADIVQNLIGTKYDKMKEFCEKYKDDGIIWFLESCDFNIFDQCRFFWKMKELGLFKYCRGILIGRPLNTESCEEVDYLYANYKHLKDLNIPVIIDCDFGHVHPCFHVVSGAIGHVKCSNGKGEIEYILK